MRTMEAINATKQQQYVNMNVWVILELLVHFAYP